MSHLDRSIHAGTLLTAISSVRCAVTLGGLDVRCSQAWNRALDGGDAHGLVPLAVALDVVFASARAALSLGNAISGGGKVDGHGVEEVDAKLCCNFFGVDIVAGVFCYVRENCPARASKNLRHVVKMSRRRVNLSLRHVPLPYSTTPPIQLSQSSDTPGIVLGADCPMPAWMVPSR